MKKIKKLLIGTLALCMTASMLILDVKARIIN